MILAFKPQFVEPILSGQKKHTIRLDPTRRWKKDQKIHFATGVRTKNYIQFHEANVVGIQHVFMTYAYNDLIEISVNGRELFGYNERLNFALNDGFTSWEDFFEWFYPIIQQSEDKCFSGRIIHWTELKY